MPTVPPHPPPPPTPNPPPPSLVHQVKNSASSFRTFALIGVAAAFCCASTAAIPHIIKPSVASKLTVADHPVAFPPHLLPVLLAQQDPSDDDPEPYLPNPGCVARYVTNDSLAFQNAYAVDVTWDPIHLMFDGVQIGFLVNASVNYSTSCDQLAAFGYSDVTMQLEVRGVSSLTQGGYHLGWFGAEDEEIEFRYWNGEEEKEYYVHQTFTMPGTSLVEGSYNASIGPKILEVEDRPACGCEAGCKYALAPFVGQGWWHSKDGFECAVNGPTCEMTLYGVKRSCQTQEDSSASANCYRPCALPPPSVPPPPSAPPPLSPPFAPPACMDTANRCVVSKCNTYKPKKLAKCPVTCGGCPQ